jgi:hypothetical protein
LLDLHRPLRQIHRRLLPLDRSQPLLQPRHVLFELATASPQSMQLRQRIPGEATQKYAEQRLRPATSIEREADHRPDNNQSKLHSLVPRLAVPVTFW